MEDCLSVQLSGYFKIYSRLTSTIQGSIIELSYMSSATHCEYGFDRIIL